MKNIYKIPAIVWLKVADFMHAALECEFGGMARVGDRRVLCLQHLKGARDILKMETVEDSVNGCPVGNAMSAARRNCIVAGLSIDASAIEREYGMTAESIGQYVPVECPAMCMKKHGVLRPWNNTTSFGREQAAAMQKFVREIFWKAVEKYNAGYAVSRGGVRYPAKEMIEDFCADTNTPDVYVEAIRREWQRRVKSGASKAVVPASNNEQTNTSFLSLM